MTINNKKTEESALICLLLAMALQTPEGKQREGVIEFYTNSRNTYTLSATYNNRVFSIHCTNYVHRLDAFHMFYSNFCPHVSTTNPLEPSQQKMQTPRVKLLKLLLQHMQTSKG